MKAKLALRGIQLFMEQAERLAKDPSAASKMLGEAIRKAKENGGTFAKIRDEAASLFRMIQAAVTGQYRDVPWASLLMALAAVLYFVNPFDLVPDFIIGAGLVDDMAVLGFVLNALKDDLEAFRQWETARAS